MTRWKLTIEYDGGAFCGWQRQASAPSVQQTIEEAVTRFSGERVTLHVAGRTDTGVHARGQVAHMDLAKETEAHVIQGALNFHLRPHPVSVLAVQPVADSFHARFDALQRHYRYRILCRTAPPALEAGRVWHIARPLALAPMQEAAALLIGKHDFSTFRAHGCQASGPVRTLDLCTVQAHPDGFDFIVAARSFLYHQVRNMVGSIVQCGTGQWSVADFSAAFAAADRTKGGPTAPAQGLYFWQVDYP